MSKNPQKFLKRFHIQALGSEYASGVMSQEALVGLCLKKHPVGSEWDQQSHPAKRRRVTLLLGPISTNFPVTRK